MCYYFISVLIMTGFFESITWARSMKHSDDFHPGTGGLKDAMWILICGGIITMTVKEMYEAMNEDYNEVFDRIGNDKWIAKYLKKFITEDYAVELRAAIDGQNWEKLFKDSHSLKGLALNLGLARLAETSTVLCESVRHGTPDGEVEILYKATEEAYRDAVSWIGKLDD